MIERYTIKFGPAVTQKDLEKALHESGDAPLKAPDLTKMKARIEIVGDFADLKKVTSLLAELQGRERSEHPSST